MKKYYTDIGIILNSHKTKNTLLLVAETYSFPITDKLYEKITEEMYDYSIERIDELWSETGDKYVKERDFWLSVINQINQE